MAICACGMRAHCAHLMHVFPRVILFVEDCQQGSSSAPPGGGAAQSSGGGLAYKPGSKARPGCTHKHNSLLDLRMYVCSKIQEMGKAKVIPDPPPTNFNSARRRRSSSHKSGTIHLRRRQIFTIFDPYLPTKAMKSSPLLGPFCGSEFWGFSLLKI